LDEPLSSLDADLRAELRSELARLQHTLTLTMVYVTHDREDATALADHVVEMRAGRIVALDREQNRRQERA
jgi:ABC-type sugar transport system ATPase subunit